jgi:zinc transporter ZupT
MPTTLKILVTLNVFLLSIFGIIFVFLTNRRIPYFYCDSISAGAFLGISLFHMIPTFSQIHSPFSITDYRNSLIFLSALCFLLLVNLIGRNSKSPDPPSEMPMYTVPETTTRNASPDFVPYLEGDGLLLPRSNLTVSVMFLIFSSITSGISMATAVENHTIIVIALTISFQKFFENTSIAVQLLKMKLSIWMMWITLILYSLLTPTIGIVALEIIDFNKTHLKRAFNAGSASVFFFIGTAQWYRIFFCPYDYAVGERVWICLLFFAGLVIVGATGLLWSSRETE